ncbi:histone-like nucleoid-structuring protein Lsr2 [Streptosporangium sp. NPDC002524]|uniref:Lsr2 family DNA-binding protein n=1 Tax=Streptosporangium sp. NPDC002524 TaxID=3154537 RepID=UPI00331DA2E0
MATKLVVICDWHEGDAEATHHNEWTGLDGKAKENDLCDTHQKPFLKAWETIDKGSTVRTTTPAGTSNGRTPRKKLPKGQHTDNAKARAWAQANNMEVSGSGRVGFHVERAWKQAGSPDLLGST